jgi:surfeit locus 1 family protein
MMQDPPRTGLGIRSIVALGVALAILLGLGTWQLQRKQWKEALLAEIAARATSQPMSALPATTCTDCEFQRIALAARFLPNSERHVFISVPRQTNGVGGPGYWVFALAEADGQKLYVNRGFVPEAEKSKARDVPADSVRIEGIVRRPEQRARFSNPNDVGRNIFYVRSPSEFVSGPTTASARDVRLDLYIDMTGPVPAAGLPLPMVGKITIPNRHLEYALTWYALAATLAAVAAVRFRRR